MRNRISCTTDRLRLLAPSTIQSVVEIAAFQMSPPYLSEHRVRIVEADESRIASAVIGNSSLYEQTVEPKDEHRLTTCTLVEGPLCRYCVAASLDDQRRLGPRTAPQRSRETRLQASRSETPPPNSAADVKLSEIVRCCGIVAAGGEGFGKRPATS